MSEAPSWRRKSFRVYQVDAFTREVLTGNPAGVVPNADGLTDLQMQAIARELNNSETAFVFGPDGDDHDVGVWNHARWIAGQDLTCDRITWHM